ncbi:MipA/OmpV family protein [Parasphingorhabdus halotolerans]|uniref:MipA/OmpV family protein n=2 Tax=Parasphingorhabdus halotolerans TaxID=2725558 RepID=A0A6H2DQS8_9SPHN|nr:MipA/OmpV family protein [Parasphingorhabdus halotolerans]
MGSFLFASAPAFALQGPPDMADSVFDDTYVTVGLGGSYSPSYDGSDDYTFSVLPVVTGSVKGIDFTPRGPGFAINVIPDRDNAKIDFLFGPVITASFDRVNDIKDTVVERLGELDTAIEVGPSAGIKINRITNPFDSLTAAVDVKWDVAGAHKGRVIAPSLTFFTPVSRGAAISLSANAEHVDDNFANYYYSISAAGSAASGLPTYAADSGWKSIGANAFGVIDLDGNALNGGFGIIVLGGYSRLLGDAKRSPITSIRGSADQWFGALGLGYTF